MARDPQRNHRASGDIKMKKPLTAVAMLAMLANTAAAKDVLLVGLESKMGTNIHEVMVEDCKGILNDHRRITKAGDYITLTIKANPEVTGKVLDVVCIYPDGTVDGDERLVNKYKEIKEGKNVDGK
jgi:hypothetical protein